MIYFVSTDNPWVSLQSLIWNPDEMLGMVFTHWINQGYINETLTKTVSGLFQSNVYILPLCLWENIYKYYNTELHNSVIHFNAKIS